jgi:transposase
MRPATRSSSTGKKIDIVERATGVVPMAEIFVAVLGASSFTYAEATCPIGSAPTFACSASSAASRASSCRIT